GGSAKQYREYCKGCRRRNAPMLPRPDGLRPERASAASRRLLIFAISPALRFLHPWRSGRNALHVRLVQRFLLLLALLHHRHELLVFLVVDAVAVIVVRKAACFHLSDVL